jgi:hypothetical protein
MLLILFLSCIRFSSSSFSRLFSLFKVARGIRKKHESEFYDLNSFTFLLRSLTPGNCLGMISLQLLREFVARLKKKHKRIDFSSRYNFIPMTSFPKEVILGVEWSGLNVSLKSSILL